MWPKIQPARRREVLATLQRQRTGHQQAEAPQADIEDVGQNPGAFGRAIRSQRSHGDRPGALHRKALQLARLRATPIRGGRIGEASGLRGIGFRRVSSEKVLAQMP